MVHVIYPFEHAQSHTQAVNVAPSTSRLGIGEARLLIDDLHMQKRHLVTNSVEFPFDDSDGRRSVKLGGCLDILHNSLTSVVLSVVYQLVIVLSVSTEYL